MKMLNSLSGRGLQAALGNAAPVSETLSRTAQAAPGASAGKDSAPAAGAAPERSVIDKAVDTLNHNTQFAAQGLRFSVDEESGKTVVKIVDTETQNVLRQFPSEDALALAHSIDKMQGLLLREKA
jgi:flagellar protein FlaG